MKFLCLACDEPMRLGSVEGPAEGSVTIAFECRRCAARIALLTNPGETQVVRALGVRIGGRTVPALPLETLTSALTASRLEAPGGAAVPEPAWSEAATARLERVPPMARPMVRAALSRHAREQGLATVTPELMDAYRARLGI